MRSFVWVLCAAAVWSAPAPDRPPLCRALTARDPALCGATPNCRQFYHQALFSKAFVAGAGDARARCLTMFAQEDGAIPSKTAKAACGKLLKSDVKGACTALRAGARQSKDFTLKDCETELAMLLGDGRVCPKIPEDARGLCEGIAALKSGEGCAEQPYCAALRTAP